MTPVTRGVAAAGGLLLVGVGVAAGRWQARRDWAAQLRTYRVAADAKLGHAEARIAYLQESVAEALRVIQRQDQANLDRADTEAAPSAVWILPDRRLN